MRPRRPCQAVELRGLRAESVFFRLEQVAGENSKTNRGLALERTQK